MLRICNASLVCIVASLAGGHDIITTAITFDREIVRVVQSHCASCHRPDGTAFSLLTYKDARPWAEAIKEEALTRRMPPWGAVKGFGEFRNDQGLTPEQIENIVSWAQGGVPEGEEKDLPKWKGPEAAALRRPRNSLLITGDTQLTRPLLLDGIEPEKVADHASAKLLAYLPDGSVEPLLWLENYRTAFRHPFLYRKPMELPKGTWIRGVPPASSFYLLPGSPSPKK